MKRCPACGRTYTNNTLTDCLNDGAPLVEDVPVSPVYPEIASRDYSEDTPLADFEEAAPAGSGTPGFRLPPLAIPAGALHGTPPPYFAAQARRRGLQWPSIVLLCFLGLFVGSLGLLIRHDLQKAASREDSPPATAPSAAADTMPDLFPGLNLDKTLTDTPDSTLRQSLITAVKGADAAEAKSLNTLDPAPLRSFYTGPALATELGEMQALKKDGTAQDGRLVARRFKAFNVNPAHTKAEVDVAEEWKTIIRSKASGKPQKSSTESNSQTISLTHTSHGWRVENIQFYEDPEQAK